MNKLPSMSETTKQEKRKERPYDDTDNSTSKKVKTNSFQELSHVELLNLFQQLPFLTKQEINILQKEQINGEFQLNAVRGQHLELAYKKYQMASSQQEGIKLMKDYLLKDDKIPIEDTAESVAHWLIEEKTLTPVNDPLPIEFKNSPFDWVESLVNKSLKEGFLNNIDTRYSSDDLTIKGFYNREAFAYAVEELVKHDLNIFYGNKIKPLERKSYFKYGFLSNGSGNGKSRACKEIRNIVHSMNMDPNHKYRKLHCNLSLDTGNSLTSVEVKYDYREQTTEGKIFGLRIYARLLGIDVQSLVKLLNPYFKTLYIDTNFFTLQNIIGKLEEFVNSDEILLLTISLDEVQFLYQALGHLKKDQPTDLTPWKRPLYAIGNYMVNTDTITDPNRRVCLIPILSGLKYINDIQFDVTEFGNQEFTLPPINPSLLGTILKDVLSPHRFNCSTPMIEMMKINDQVTIQQMGILLLQALVIPEVLSKTLQEIKSFLSNISFKEWTSQYEALFPQLKDRIDKSVKGYLIKQEFFQDPKTQKELLPRLLCGLNLQLTKKEKDLFLKGLLYKTPTDRLYIAPRYFKQVIKCDPYISSKLSKNYDINPRDFERIDLKCICYRITILKKSKSIITIKELFPSCVAIASNEQVELPEKEFTIVTHDTFITKVKDIGCVKIDVSKCTNNPSEIYSYTSKTHPCIDAHFWLTSHQTSDESPKTIPALFLLHYKNYSLGSGLSVVKWLDKNQFADIAISEFKDVNIYFVMITTTKVSEEEMKKLKEHKHHKKVILISHQDTASEKYFPTNLLPHYKGFLFQKISNISNLTVSNDYPQEVKFQENEEHQYATLSEWISALELPEMN